MATSRISNGAASSDNIDISPNLSLDSQIGLRVRLLRKDRSVSQRELGELLGVTFQQVQKYEKGSNRIGAGRLWQISQILEAPITYFFDGLFSELSAINPELLSIFSELDSEEVDLLSQYRVLSKDKKNTIKSLIGQLSD
ncbi:MAG: helix-turn-helix transcriptional regulator [Pseudomonadota bacterium]